MKRATITLALFLTSCISVTEQKTNKLSNPEVKTIDNSIEDWSLNYEVYTLEGCEYIVVGHGDRKWGSHKGNCKNPIHKTK
jgi:hypothetical protein